MNIDILKNFENYDSMWKKLLDFLVEYKVVIHCFQFNLPAKQHRNIFGTHSFCKRRSHEAKVEKKKKEVTV